MPNRDAIFMSGMMCPIRVTGRPGMLMSHTCVKVIFLPSGRLMWIGWVVARITKMEVPPVSAMACVGAMSIT